MTNFEQTFIAVADRVEPLKTYIAGPTTGLRHFNYEKFSSAQVEIRIHLDPANIFNPADHDLDMGFNPYCFDTGDIKAPTCKNTSPHHAKKNHQFSLRAALAWDTARITESDFITLLPGWSLSKGTRAGLALAFALKIPVFQLVPNMCILYAEQLSEEDWLESLEPIRVAKPNPLLEAAQDKGSVITPVAKVGEAPKVPLSNDGKFTVKFVDDGDLSRINLESYDWENAVKRYEDAAASGTVFSPITQFKGGGIVGEVRATSVTGGQKGRTAAQFSLIPTDPLRQLAEHYGKSAEKYDANQWRAGYFWSWSYDALQWHANAFWSGEDFDEETGSNHMVAVAWHAFTLLEFYKNNKNQDDRYRK